MPPDPPKVSVLIPVYNGAEFVGGAIQSARTQSLADLEIIVIDDASTDNTCARVSSVMTEEPRLQLVRAERNGGPGAARSLGLQAARGEWIAILDADDGMAPDRLERLVSEAERDALDVIADNLALVDPGLGRVVGDAFPLAPGAALEITPERFLDHTRPGGRVNLGWMQPVIRRGFLVRNGIDWPDLRHAEDMVLTMRLLTAGARFRLIGDALYRYTQRRGTRSGRASDASRTGRSIAEQQRAVALVRADPATGGLSLRTRRRLLGMDAEIAATGHALDLRDHVQAGRPRAAAVSALRALMQPVALARCLHARYVLGRQIK